MTANNFETQLQTLKEAAQKARDYRNKALSQKELYEQQLQKLNQKLLDLGVEPANLDNTIASLEQEIEENIKKAKEMIPWRLLGLPEPE